MAAPALLLLRALAAWQPGSKVLRAFFIRLRNLLVYIFNLVFRRRIASANMASPVDSKAPIEDGPPPRRRQMIGLKTKEECRLGNETITVWTVELPRKHAEGVLRYASLSHEGVSSHSHSSADW